MKIFFLLLLFSNMVSAKAYKCEINGKRSYQMHPCPEGQGDEIDTMVKQPVISLAEKQMRLRNERTMQEVKRLSAKHKIKIETGVAQGMTMAEVRQSLGRPDAVNASQYGDGAKREQWVYRHIHKSTQYVYFEGGIVTSQQW
ncbi:MAG: hypothetical protein KAT04_10485 [Methylococcales bacterium]|nr:hypothetical protein [Methylococcales bacterium]